MRSKNIVNGCRMYPTGSTLVSQIEAYFSPGVVVTVDNSHYRLILKLGKEMQIDHHS
jgi:hypothetical protein